MFIVAYMGAAASGIVVGEGVEEKGWGGAIGSIVAVSACATAACMGIWAFERFESKKKKRREEGGEEIRSRSRSMKREYETDEYEMVEVAIN